MGDFFFLKQVFLPQFNDVFYHINKRGKRYLTSTEGCIYNFMGHMSFQRQIFFCCSKSDLFCNNFVILNESAMLRSVVVQ